MCILRLGLKQLPFPQHIIKSVNYAVAVNIICIICCRILRRFADCLIDLRTAGQADRLGQIPLTVVDIICADIQIIRDLLGNSIRPHGYFRRSTVPYLHSLICRINR